MVTNKTPGEGGDILRDSANNLYDGVSMADLDGFVERYPLNSRLAKRDGQLVEEVYRVGGLYDAPLRRMIGHIEAALRDVRAGRGEARGHVSTPHPQRAGCLPDGRAAGSRQGLAALTRSRPTTGQGGARCTP